MSFLNNSIKANMMLIILIVSTVSVLTPMIPSDNTIRTEASINVSTQSIIYKTGTWSVNSSESYTDAEIILTGNLIIQAGGILTLRNTTLIMNCSLFANPLWIVVKSGGTLRIWDNDNNPNTKEDGSLINDSINDVDDGGILDYRYYFSVNKNGKLDINNSVVRECGKYDGGEPINTWGLYIESDNNVIKNTTFDNCDRGLVLRKAENTTIEYINMTNIDIAVDAEYANGTVIKFCWLNSTTIGQGLLVKNSNNLKILNNNISTYRDSIFLQGVETSMLSDNYFSMAYTSSAYKTVSLYECKNISISNCVGNAYRKVFQFDYCENITVYKTQINSSGSNLVYDQGVLTDDSNNITFEGCTFYNIYGYGIKCQYTDDVIIKNCTFNNTDKDGVYLNRVNRFLVFNCIFDNASAATQYQAIYLTYADNGWISDCNITYSNYRDISISRCDNIKIRNNKIGGNSNTRYGIYSSYLTNSYIMNNKIYLHYGNAIYISWSGNNLIHNNTLTGYNEQGTGIGFSGVQAPHLISNCTISDYGWGIDDEISRIYNTNISSCKNFGVYGEGTHLVNVTFYDNGRAIGATNYKPVIAMNCTIIASRMSEAIVYSTGNLSLINCSFNKAGLQQFSGGSRIYIGWWADVYVEDIKGFVPGAKVTVYNKTGFKEVEGLTGDDGHALIPVIEEFWYYDVIKIIQNWNPHNITAFLYPDIANVIPKPTVTSNSNYTITFPGNTYPAPPQNLMAESMSDDVILTWEYPNLVDLDHFEVFRSLDPETFNFLAPIGTAGKNSRMWLDLNGASDWSTYYYCIRANDTIDQLGNASNADACGDWVVALNVKQDFSSLDIDMNGSIRVEAGGSLNLSDTKIKINTSEDERFGVLVMAEGVLRISDLDNNKNSISDASNITSKNASIPIYLRVEPGGKLYMNNSIAYNIGWLEKGQKFFSDNSGLHISGSGSILRGNFIIGTPKTFNGIELVDTTDVRVLDNTIYKFNGNPIYLSYSPDCTINNNTIYDSVDEGIYSDHSINITLSNNTINNCNYGIYLWYSPESRIFDNYIHDNQIGIYIRYSENSVIHNNTIYNHTSSYGFYCYYADYSVISENYVYDNYYGIRVYRSYFITLLSNQILDITQTGIYFYDCSNSKLINNTISNCDYEGLLIYDRAYEHVVNTIISRGNITGCLYGIYFSYSHFIDLENVDIWNNLYGVYADESGSISIRNSRINNNIGFGIYAEYLSYPHAFSLLIENTTLSTPVGKELGVDKGAFIVVINVSIPFNRIQFNDGESKVAFFWHVNVLVKDMFDQPASGAEVKIQQIDGEFSVGFTDSEGYLNWQLVHERTTFRDDNISSNPYTISAIHGNHSGENETVISGPGLIIVKLSNQPPNVVDLGVNPIFPSTLEDLQLAFGYSDPEGDPEYPNIIKWYMNGQEDKSLANTTRVNSTITAKDQVWFARVWVFDGAAYSDPLDSNWIHIQNTPPVVSDIILTPNSPASTADITVSYSFDDVDDDLEGETIIEWHVDRGEGFEDAHLSGSVLQSINTKKGELWKVRVRPNDGEGYGEWVESSHITIGNAPPEVSNCIITPKSPRSNQTFGVSYEYFDIDSDPETGSIIKWFRNNVEQLDLNGSLTIDQSRTEMGEEWHYECIPRDGENFGEVAESEHVIIGNTPPNVIEIMIHPANPTTADDLTVTFKFSDIDLDKENVNTSIEWLRKRPDDIEFSHTGLKVKTLSSVYTTKDEVWTCLVTPHDGKEYGEPIRCELEVKIQNSKPIVSEVTITPEKPTTVTDLEANYDYSDLDGDAEDGTVITWYRDNSSLSELNNELIIPSAYTKKGEVWYFTAKPKDGIEFGDIVKSNPITINNNLPSATNLIITPREPSGDEFLTASYEFIDADGDLESTPEIRWYKNGLLQSLFNDQFIVESNATEKGEIWYFNLRVFDGEDYGEINSSPYAVIENSKPVIISVTPAPGHLNINETEAIEFYVQAEDPDGDLLLFKWKIDKTAVSDEDYYLFETDYESAGNYKMNLTIQDVGKNSFTLYYIWDITVENINRQPQLVVMEPIAKNPKIKEDTSLKFLIVESDPDTDDTLTITWYFDNVVVQSSGSSYTYFADYTSAGKHTLRAVVTDGMDTTEYSWNLTVKDVEETEGLWGMSWDEISIIIEVIVVLITAMFAMIGIFKVRKKMNKLKEYIKRIEEISESEKTAREKEKELLGLKKQVKDEFSDGLISENHYIILIRIVDDALGESRKAIVESKVMMPETLKLDVEQVLEDGVVTKEEYKRIVEEIKTSEELSDLEKQKLNRLMAKWMRESKNQDLNK
ncbi:right-handed parallel beta-helix repeat-containing protein [[Eubacterium] cellulosolvens]